MEPEDTSLINRESAITGLSLVLDPCKMLSLMQNCFPDASIQSVSKIYIRYKPATNCLVKYLVDDLSGSRQWYAKAFTINDRDKLLRIEAEGKTRQLAPIVIIDKLLVLYPFPLDGKLKLLTRLVDHSALQQLFTRVLYPNTMTNRSIASIEVLQYKPERRFVARLIMNSGESVVLKAYTQQRYQLANLSRRRKLNSDYLLDVVGRSSKHRLLVHRWIDGQNLTLYYHSNELNPAPFRECGRYLADFHQHSKRKKVVEKTTTDFIYGIDQCVSGLINLIPDIEKQLVTIRSQLHTALTTLKSERSVIHGDFYAKQVLITTSGIRLIDLDDVCYWFSGYDLGLFIAHLERDQLLGTLSSEQSQTYQSALLAGYRQLRALRQSDVELFSAIGLLQLSHHPFRNAVCSWKSKIYQLVKRCAEHLSTYQLLINLPDAEQSLPRVSELLDPPCATQLLRDNLGHFSNQDTLVNIDVVRHKPGKRMLIEYTFKQPDGEQHAILGKVRLKRFDKHTWNVNHALYQDQFGENNSDRIMVPSPLGYAKSHHIWFQKKVTGTICFDDFCHDGEIAERIAQTLYKLHSSKVTTERTHSHQDEIELLEKYLHQAATRLPDNSDDILDVLSHCKRQVNQLEALKSPTTIHRDFYHDQVLIDNDHVYLLDLDLLCNGDPALDIGNFIAHIEEQCLRQFDEPDYAQLKIERFIQRYQELAGCDLRSRIETFTTLSWARHIFISHRIPQRNPWTERIIQQCKQRIC